MNSKKAWHKLFCNHWWIVRGLNPREVEDSCIQLTWTRLWSIPFAFVKIINFIMAVLRCWLTHKATSWPVLITEKSQVMIRIQFPQPPKPRIAAIGLLSCLDYLNISFTPLTRQESTKVKKIDGNDPIVAVLSKNPVILNNKVRFHRHGWAWA